MTASMTSVLARPRAGLQEEIKRTERDDNGRGFERDETVAYQRLTAWKARRAQRADRQHRLSTYLLRLVAEGDAHAAARSATEDDLNRELDNPAEDWDQAVPRTVLPQAAAEGALVGGGVR